MTEYEGRLSEAVAFGVPYHRTAETCNWSYEKTHDDPCNVHACGKCIVTIARAVEKVVLEHSPEVKAMREALARMVIKRVSEGSMPDAGML